MVTNLNAHWRVESRQSGVHTSQHWLSVQKLRMDCDVTEQAKSFCMEAEWNARTSPSLIVISKIKALNMAYALHPGHCAYCEVSYLVSYSKGQTSITILTMSHIQQFESWKMIQCIRK